MKVFFIDAEREGYDPSQVYETTTLGELAEVFALAADRKGEDVRVYLRHDGGYTYGGITSEQLEVGEVEEEE